MTLPGGAGSRCCPFPLFSPRLIGKVRSGLSHRLSDIDRKTGEYRPFWRKKMEKKQRKPFLNRVTGFFWGAGWVLLVSLAPSFASDLPSFSGATGWINSPPLHEADLKGKVVLIDFWEYTCVNCVRTFPVLKKWYRTYGPDGLVMIGIHTPEFSFARQEDNVARAVRKYQLLYPVAIDSDRRLWDRFHNHYWPAQYLFDRNGKLIFHTIGEGDDERMESAIRSALGKRQKDSASGSEPDFPESMTPELYAGTMRRTMASPPDLSDGKPADYAASPEVMDNINLSGSWISQSEYIEPVFGAHPPVLTLPYHAAGVRIVLRHANGARPSRILVLQDGKPLPRTISGSDIRYDRKGRSYILVRAPRMYTLVSHQPFGGHRLVLLPADSSVKIYSFTFDPS